MIDPSLPWAEFDYTPTTRFAQEPFIRVPNRPSRGWSVVLPLRGNPQTIKGTTAKDVARNATALYKLNGFNVDPNHLWFNLNLQWLENTPAKYHTVPRRDLLAAATPVDVVNSDTHAQQKVSPKSWTDSFWQFIKTYTESETYDWETFRGFLKQYQRMLNPTENALLGNSTWYVRFTLALDKVERNPAYTGEAARKWINDEIQV